MGNDLLWNTSAYSVETGFAYDARIIRRFRQTVQLSPLWTSLKTAAQWTHEI